MREYLFPDADFPFGDAQELHLCAPYLFRCDGGVICSAYRIADLLERVVA